MRTALREVEASSAAAEGTTPPGSRRIAAGLWLAGLVVTALVAGGFAFGIWAVNVHNGLIAASSTAVGLLVGLRRPGHRMSRLFLALGLAQAVIFFGRQYGGYASAHPGSKLPAATLVAWLGVWPLALVIVLCSVTLMSFPDGRLPSPRWRLVVVVLMVAGAGLAVVSALWPVEYAADRISIAPPFHLAGFATAHRLWSPLAHNAYLLDQLAFVACVIARFRRAGAEEAQQLKWFVYAVTVGLVVLLVGVAFGSTVPGLLMVPVVFLVAGAAILRYRLYDIDLVIDKTVVVGAMAVLVTAVYAGIVVGIGALLGLSGQPNIALSLAATALVAVAFAPARQRVQLLANRLAYGHRVSPYEALARLPAELDAARPPSEVLQGLLASLAAGVGARETTLWLGRDAELVPVASWPGGVDEPRPAPAALASIPGHVRPIHHLGELRGAISLTKPAGEQLSAIEDRLFADLAAQAGLVVENIGLTTELEARLQQISAQAEALRAAAKRIVAAQDDARRRLERDLHDGAQQQLVTVALALGSVADDAAAVGADGLATKVQAVRDQLAQALADLRDLARGIHPSILTEEGLEAALGSLAERSPLTVRLAADVPARLPPEVESTAFFVVCEALTNAAKHAGATTVTVSASVAGGRVHLDVADEGQGGADGGWGAGLQGLADRVATLDGRLTVASPAGGGTRLHAEIPCG